MGESIRVVCRIRPLNKLEKSKNSKVCVTFPSKTTITVGTGGKPYSFDAVLNCCSQLEAYDVIGRPVVESVINGYNGTIFVYGQTSSGKTHTMEGDLKDPENKGIIPRVLEDIFLRINNMEGNLEFTLKVSYMELYMEKIKDLFDISKDNLPVNEDKDHIPFVKGLTERFVGSYDDVINALDDGKLNRHVSFTNMNAQSSRSHSIFTIMIHQKNLDSGQALDGRLNLVDLAGSEKVSKTGAEGNTLEEAKMINKSLSTLGNVINALVEGTAHVPYRDSKLTRILQQSLGGNSKTTIVICASPAEYNEAETKSTILFGVRAKNIKNDVKVNLHLSADQWQKLYDTEHEKNNKAGAIIKKLEEELTIWRKGNKVEKANWFTPDKYSSVVVTATPEMAIPPTTPSTGEKTAPDGVPKGAKPSADMTNDDQLKSLYKELDEKDSEIAQLTQKCNKLKKTLEELQAGAATFKDEIENMNRSAAASTKELELKKAELKDMVSALEDLAMKYDQKNSALEERNKELEDMNILMKKIKEKAKDVEQNKVNKLAMDEMQKKTLDSLKAITQDLYSLGITLAPSLGKTPIKKKDKVDDQLSYLDYFVGQLKASAAAGGEIGKLLSTDVSSKNEKAPDPLSLEGVKKDAERKIKEMTMRISESEKAVVRANEERQKFQDQFQKVSKELTAMQNNAALVKEIKANKEANPDLFEKLTGTVEKNASHYHEQITRLRDEAEKAAKNSERFREQNIMMKMQLDTLMTDLETMKKRLNSDGKDPIENLKEQAKRDIKPIEESILQDLQNLHNLRKLFVQDLRNRIKQNSTRQSLDLIKEMDEDEVGSGGSVQQREKINFLNNTLETLTVSNKELVRDNADLHCELPRLTKRLNATVDRINELEDTLRMTKERAIMEKQRHLAEMMRLKESIFGGNNKGMNIAKPIRVGGGG